MNRITPTILSAMVLLVFSGCGGGGDTTPPGPTTYDMWDYLSSNHTINKSFDLYPTDSSYAPNGSVSTNAATLVESINSTTSRKLDTYADNVLTYTTTIQLLETTIDEVGESPIPRFVQVNQYAGGDSCTLANHFDSYTPYIGYTYKDVIELDCESISIFFAKNLGRVVGQNKNSYTDRTITPATTIITYSVALYNSTVL